MRGLVLGFVLLVSWPADRANAENPRVRVTSGFGAFDIELCGEPSARCLGAAPGTVANFLAYVDRGAYTNSIVHRSIAKPSYPDDFVIQGGGFFLDMDAMLIREIPTDPPIANEFNQTNARGSVAMAMTDTPDSATDQWFINLADNSGPCPGTPQEMGLDCQNGGFTVFGQVIGPGMQIVDTIAAIQATGRTASGSKPAAACQMRVKLSCSTSSATSVRRTMRRAIAMKSGAHSRYRRSNASAEPASRAAVRNRSAFTWLSSSISPYTGDPPRLDASELPPRPYPVHGGIVSRHERKGYSWLSPR